MLKKFLTAGLAVVLAVSGMQANIQADDISTLEGRIAALSKRIIQNDWEGELRHVRNAEFTAEIALEAAFTRYKEALDQKVVGMTPDEVEAKIGEPVRDVVAKLDKWLEKELIESNYSLHRLAQLVEEAYERICQAFEVVLRN